MEIRSREYYQTQATAAEEPRAVQFFNFLASIEHIHVRTLETVLDAIRRASRS